MINKRAEIEFLYYTGKDVADIYASLSSKYPGLEFEYVDEVCTMLENDDYLLEE